MKSEQDSLLPRMCFSLLLPCISPQNFQPLLLTSPFLFIPLCEWGSHDEGIFEMLVGPPYHITYQEGPTSCCWIDPLVTCACLSRRLPLRHSLVLNIYGIFPICLANSKLLDYMGLNWAKVALLDRPNTTQGQSVILGPCNSLFWKPYKWEHAIEAPT